MSTEEDKVRTLDLYTVYPASITIVPDLDHHATGSVHISSGTETLGTTVFYSFETSWRILGDLEVDLTTSWGSAEDVYYWYRVEGECGSVTCDEFGVEHRNCNRMTFITTVSARNLAELCDTLGNPRVNAPVPPRVLTISRYSRPMFRTQIQEGQCNVLETVEFCHIPECLDYCVDTESGLLSAVESEASEPLPSPPEAPRLSAASGHPDALLVSASFSSFVSASGYEDEGPDDAVSMEVPSETVSACGCLNVGMSLAMRHNMNRSSRVSRFVKSNGLSMPETLNMYLSSGSELWSSKTHLRGNSEDWVVSFGFECRTDLWAFSLSVRQGQKQTRLSFESPAEFICSGSRPNALVQVYFDQGAASQLSGKSINVVTPIRAFPRTASYGAEVFVNGIFVPHTIYYDEVGVFKDYFWDYSPLEIEINPISANKTSIMTLDGIA